jgi:hypothetical protein
LMHRECRVVRLHHRIRDLNAEQFHPRLEAYGIRAISFLLHPYGSLTRSYFPMVYAFPVEPPYVLVVYSMFAKFGDAENPCSSQLLYMQCLLPTNHM